MFEPHLHGLFNINFGTKNTTLCNRMAAVEALTVVCPGTTSFYSLSITISLPKSRFLTILAVHYGKL